MCSIMHYGNINMYTLFLDYVLLDIYELTHDRAREPVDAFIILNTQYNQHLVGPQQPTQIDTFSAPS